MKGKYNEAIILHEVKNARKAYWEYNRSYGWTRSRELTAILKYLLNLGQGKDMVYELVSFTDKEMIIRRHRYKIIIKFNAVNDVTVEISKLVTLRV